MTRIPSTEETQRAAFAAIPVTPTPTTASNTVRGRTIAIASTDAREAARPVPPATMSTLAILLFMENGQAPAKHSTREPKPARSARRPPMNTRIMWTQTAMANVTIAVRPFP